MGNATLTAANALGAEDRDVLMRQLGRAKRRARIWAFALALPMLAYLLVILLAPIAVLLVRGVENPEVVAALPLTARSLDGWDPAMTAPPRAFAALAIDLSKLPGGGGQAGGLARRLNTETPGARSLVMNTFRAMPLPPGLSDEEYRSRILEIDPRWSESKYWMAIAKNGSRWTPDYLLTAMDLQREGGQITAVDPSRAVFTKILWRTCSTSFIVTLWCLLLAYPLAYWLSTLPARKANLLMILVLVPFWTSILVRIAAWIVLLQREGLINHGLQDLGLINEPLALLFNRTGVVIAMVHVLLPFMILPLYSVMKSVPSTYQRAAVSLGSTPLAAFWRVYVPQTYAGIGAGALMVFILAIGYYVTPALLGGADDQMLSYYVAQYINVNVNWGVAAALSTVLLATTLVLYALYRRLLKTELSMT
ncbi:putative spermidine/putrescine transport system permease protein [Rhodoferax sp. OV413]|uniref:ABC transporter permease n=1 Tax=Rhodoferax sp. OV413 TaxID=1855285 RepID=UPI00088B00B5|nr:ABC transporter permease [Rhodoferax sp. OV413]SDP73135.1 putative spermidine/putrescine transport system permease protein [Rhodoferax sp. OV413]